MTKLMHKFALNEIYYGVINHNILKVKLEKVSLSVKQEPIYNDFLPESSIFASETLARKFILRNDADRINLIDKTI